MPVIHKHQQNPDNQKKNYESPGRRTKDLILEPRLELKNKTKTQREKEKKNTLGFRAVSRLNP